MRPFVKIESFALKSKRDAVRPVVVLHKTVGPVAIFFAILFVVIFAVKGQSGRTYPHVDKEL